MTIEMLTGFSAVLVIVMIVINSIILKKVAGPAPSPLEGRLDNFEKGVEKTEKSVTDQISRFRDESTANAREARSELNTAVQKSGDAVLSRVTELASLQKNQLDAFTSNITAIHQSSEQRELQFKKDVESKLAAIESENSKKLDRMCAESAESAKLMREDTSKALKDFNDSLLLAMGQMVDSQKSLFMSFSLQLSKLTEMNESKLETLRSVIENKLGQIQQDNAKQLAETRKEVGAQTKEMREENSGSMRSFNQAVVNTLTQVSDGQKESLKSFSEQLSKLTDSNEKKMESLRSTLELKMGQIQQENGKKLEEMRKTVDEKLHETLERRLSESFQVVSSRLEEVQRGLGEMQALASGVGDLKKVLSNVKTRGNWGEMQLGVLLEQTLTTAQYERNVRTKDDSGENVEFAIKLPGRNGSSDEVVWLPIDAKFPQDLYVALADAAEKGDNQAVEIAKRELENGVKKAAKDICEKYLNPPRTTDFAIMFLPTEGLYAEVVRQTSLIEMIQRDCRVTVAGPSTITALLNSLHMGFRTLAIEKRSSEVWKILGAVKTEFGKFGEAIDSVRKKIEAAGKEFDKTATRTRAVVRRLREVQELPAVEAAALIEVPVSDEPSSDDQDDISV